MIQFHHPKFSDERIINALHASSRTVSFRYELLNGFNVFKKELKNILSASIENQALAQIKRTAKFTMYEDPDIDFQIDRIKPIMRLWIPPMPEPEPQMAFLSHVQPITIKKEQDAGGWVDFPLGIFLLSSPTRVHDQQEIIRQVDAYDSLVILRDNELIYRLTAQAGLSGPEIVRSELKALGINNVSIPDTRNELARTIEFEPGSGRLTSYNELLRTANYTTLTVDEDGYFTAVPYINPNDRNPMYAYRTDGKSVIFTGAEEELDLFEVPNQFTIVRTNEEQEPLMSIFTNINPNSPTSTVRRGRIISDRREIQDIADQAALDNYTERIAIEASQVYGRIRFNSALMPFHGDSDVLLLDHEPLGINGKFMELNWSMDLEVNGVMTHELRQIVDVGGGRP